MGTEWEPTVDISDVISSTIKIAAGELRENDIVFDAWGDEHRVTKVRVFKSVVHFWREDRLRESFPCDWTMTVKRES